MAGAFNLGAGSGGSPTRGYRSTTRGDGRHRPVPGPQRDPRRSSWRTGTQASPSGRLEHKLGIKGSPTRELYFDDCPIPESRLVGAEGDKSKIALRTLDHTRITIAAQALGIAQGALDYALGYVRERKQFGQAIAEFQGLQFMLADMASETGGGPPACTYAAAARPDRAMTGEKVDDLTFFSSAYECLASDVAISVTTDAVQLLGGYGYVNDYPVERMMRDAKITQIYEGTNQIQRMVMARQLLK